VKNLIVNADDLGWTAGVNRGIAEAHGRGIVTSASLLANGTAFAAAVELTRSTPTLGLGVHLNLSDGTSRAAPEKVRSLLNEAGEFHSGPETLLLKMAKRTLVLREVEEEWDAQIQMVLDTGLYPTHLDGHKHVHMLPGLFEIALRLAARHGIKAVRVSHENATLGKALSSGHGARSSMVLKQGAQALGLRLLARDARKQAEQAGIATADYFCGIAQTGELTKNGLIQLLRNLPEGTTELMCHPGYADQALRGTATRLQDSRETELAILTDPEIRNVVASQGIGLINYSFAAVKYEQ
jgi:hopanoid biosynthesis associated protein HpnK